MGMRLAGLVCLGVLTSCGVVGGAEQRANTQVLSEATVPLTTVSTETTRLAAAAPAVEAEPSTEETPVPATNAPELTTSTAPPTTSSTTAPTTTTEAPTTSTPSFADSFAVVSTGVVRVEAILCDGTVSTGSGFLVSSGHILTAAHVIGDAPVVRVTRDGGVDSRASVAGSDSKRDLALLSLEQPFEGHRFTISDGAVRVGDEVAALGHPRGLPLTFTSGRVSNLNFSDQGVLFHQTDTPINEGSSGGPLIDQWGRAIGMADWKFTDVDGIAFVVAAAEIHSFLESPAASAVDLELGCEEDAPPLDVPEEFALIAQTFVEYANLVNTAKESVAWDNYLTPAHQERTPKEEFTARMSTTFIDELSISEITPIDDTHVTAAVQFVSLQAPEHGPDAQTCTTWNLLYDLVLTDRWRIDNATNAEGSPAACPAEE